MTPAVDGVLLVEDDRIEADLICDQLAGGGAPRPEVDRVSRLEAALGRLALRRYSVVLLDLNLPDGNGISNLHRVKAAAPTTAVVILTNVEDEGGAVAAMAEGAQDYLIKRHITPELLSRSIRYAVAREAAETSLRISEERFALAVEGARDGIWDWDLEAGHVYYSPRWLALLGLPELESAPTPATWLDRVVDGDRPGLERAIGAHLAGAADRLEHEFRIRNAAGQEIWALCRGVAVRDRAGRATRLAGSLTDISDRKATEAHLMHELLHDTLTGLANRALFLDRLDLALKRYRRDARNLFAVLFLDIDRFKTVNDSLGHGAGDSLLVGLARRLQTFLRPTDSIARMGGDEFAVLLHDISTAGEATLVAERLQELLARAFVIEGRDVYATASIGIAISSPGYERPGDLLRDADLAMYRAKHQRSGSYSVFNSVVHGSVLHRLELENDLRSAVSRNQLVTHYQPIVALDGMRVIGFEALVRWQHPLRGLIGPDEFIPVAEKGGTIGPLSWWVMHEACRQARTWRESHSDFANLSMSVNISSRLFSEPEFANRTVAVLEQTGLAPEALHLEITENALVQHETTTIRELATLQAIGVKFHLDDFGTGYSSLSYLSLFSYDTIKIDRSFIGGDSHRNRRIVGALLGLGRGLGIEVIAEGVETPEVAQELRDLKCRVAQGFWFSKPLTADDASALLARSLVPGNGRNGSGHPH